MRLSWRRPVPAMLMVARTVWPISSADVQNRQGPQKLHVHVERMYWCRWKKFATSLQVEKCKTNRTLMSPPCLTAVCCLCEDAPCQSVLSWSSANTVLLCSQQLGSLIRHCSVGVWCKGSHVTNLLWLRRRSAFSKYNQSLYNQYVEFPIAQVS